jgi:23S rRNA pseudouridine955/2504/2580 synthase
MKQEFIIKEEDSGRKVNKVIKKHFADLSLWEIQKLFRKKDIKINWKPAKSDSYVNLWDKIFVFTKVQAEKKEKKSSVSEKNFKENFKVIYEDDEILVCDKVAWVAVHPWTNHNFWTTMIDFAQHHLNQKNPKWDNFIQLAHRLDADTSWVLLFAKKSEALRNINEQIKTRKVEKKYYALIKWEIKEKSWKITCLVKRQIWNKNTKVVLAKKWDKDALMSQTDFKIKELFENKWQNFSLMDLNIKTWRMHQIRVHMQSKWTPLVMDQMYWDFPFNKKFQKEFWLKRHFLHSYFLEITHPKTWKKIKFNSELSKDLKNCLDKLKNQ